MDEEQFRERLTRMAEGLPPPGESQSVVGRARRRIARNSALGAAALLVMALTGLSLRPSGERVIGFADPTGGAVEVSAVSGSLKCTAWFANDIVGPGDSTSIVFSVQNLGSEPVRPQNWYSKVRVRDAQGKHVWPIVDPTFLLRGPELLELGPNGKTNIPGAQPLIQWPGTLTVEPTCHLDRDVRLPSVRLYVRVPETIPGDEALRRAMMKTGGLFDPCSPKADGSWSEGLLQPPKVANQPAKVDREKRPEAKDIRPMAVRCAAKLRQESGFWKVDLVLVAPASAPEVPVDSPVVGDQQEELPGTGSMAVARLQFIVTPEATVHTDEVGMTYRTRPIEGLQKVFYGVFSYGSGSGVMSWRRSADGLCGDQGWRGWPIQVTVRFINACPP